MHPRFSLTLLLASAFFLGVSNTSAGPITFLSAEIGTCVGSFGTVGPPPDPCTLQASSSGAAITNSGTISTSGETLSYAASSVTMAGSLGGWVSVSSNTLNSSGPGIMVDALEDLEDSVTISFAPLNGQTGYMVLQYTLDGTNAVSGTDASPYGCVKLGINNPTFTFGCQGYHQSSVAGTFSTGVFPFIYGQAFPLWFQLESIAGTGFGSGRTTGLGSSAANFYNTATIGGLLLYDQNMNVLSAAPTFTSTLGISYQDVNIPEPSTAALFIVAGAVCVLARRLWSICAVCQRNW